MKELEDGGLEGARLAVTAGGLAATADDEFDGVGEVDEEGVGDSTGEEVIGGEGTGTNVVATEGSDGD